MKASKLMISHTKTHLIIRYGGYDYEIAWNRIKTEGHLLSWVTHLLEKIWMDQWKMIDLIRYVESIKGWDIDNP